MVLLAFWLDKEVAASTMNEYLLLKSGLNLNSACVWNVSKQVTCGPVTLRRKQGRSMKMTLF